MAIGSASGVLSSVFIQFVRDLARDTPLEPVVPYLDHNCLEVPEWSSLLGWPLESAWVLRWILSGWCASGGEGGCGAVFQQRSLLGLCTKFLHELAGV